MKKILASLLLLLTLSLNAQEISEKEKQDNYLHELIADLVNKEEITSDPVIILNEQLLTSDILDTLRISKFEITSYAVLKKEQEDVENKFGKQGLNGVLMIKTKSYQETVRDDDYLAQEDVLYLIDGKATHSTMLKNMDPETIAKIDVLKDQDSIAKYTSKEVHGIIKIQLKKESK
ncbi:hypothetical protein [Christiangramia sp. LLG6405-1]|uniref:hypothetical protein n=1 Tax=Christiangramia sp. LLG6405-1 TaxID=3160832 RepID=UPI003864235D